MIFSLLHVFQTDAFLPEGVSSPARSTLESTTRDPSEEELRKAVIAKFGKRSESSLTLLQSVIFQRMPRHMPPHHQGVECVSLMFASRWESHGLEQIPHGQ